MDILICAEWQRLRKAPTLPYAWLRTAHSARRNQLLGPWAAELKKAKSEPLYNVDIALETSSDFAALQAIHSKQAAGMPRNGCIS